MYHSKRCSFNANGDKGNLVFVINPKGAPSMYNAHSTKSSALLVLFNASISTNQR